MKAVKIFGKFPRCRGKLAIFKSNQSTSFPRQGEPVSFPLFSFSSSFLNCLFRFLPPSPSFSLYLCFCLFLSLFPSLCPHEFEYRRRTCLLWYSPKSQFRITFTFTIEPRLPSTLVDPFLRDRFLQRSLPPTLFSLPLRIFAAHPRRASTLCQTLPKIFYRCLLLGTWIVDLHLSLHSSSNLTSTVCEFFTDLSRYKKEVGCSVYYFSFSFWYCEFISYWINSPNLI